MDLGFIRRTRILDHVTFIMMSYFGELEPQVIKLPEGENSDEILALVGVQFKALVELGLVIEPIWLSEFFENEGPDVRPTTPVLNRTDSLKRVFVTMEGTHERPQELAIFCANGLQVFEIKHVVGHVENLSYQEQVDKKFVHGLTAPLKPIYLDKVGMINLLRITINDCNPEEIVYWDDKLTDIIPIKDKMRKIEKPNWCFRASHYSYHATRRFEFKEMIRCLNVNFLGHCHNSFECKEREPMSIGDLVKQDYGYSCAIKNAYEMMHLHLAKPITRLNL